MPSVARSVAAGAATLLLVLAGCGTNPGQDTPAATPPLQVVTMQPEPVAVTVPAIDAHSTLVGLGRNPDNTAAVPPVTEPMQASWYEPGVRPGAQGPAVILGHVSGRPPGATRSVPGVFAHLADLKPGDEILVDRADGSTAVFTVTAVEDHPKTDFPTTRVWGDTVGPELRLITCGGVFDPNAHSYTGNLVIFAQLKGMR